MIQERPGKKVRWAGVVQKIDFLLIANVNVAMALDSVVLGLTIAYSAPGGSYAAHQIGLH